ncbi:MAG: VC1465 family Xer recombination activation factor [Sideroxyarcus sp.]|nr:VC1465 family Xer recombination activation factor [Sideroxyarcus sp.]
MSSPKIIAERAAEKRRQNPDYQPSLAELKAVDAVLVARAREAREAGGFDLGTSPHGLSVDGSMPVQETREGSILVPPAKPLLTSSEPPASLEPSARSQAQQGDTCRAARTNEHGKRQASRRKASRRWIDPQDFRDLRRKAGLTRREAARALDVTGRTIQNWETGGARIPWMAYRMLRILQGYALPGKDWEGWTIGGDTLYAPNGRHFTAGELQHIEQVFSMARLWQKLYAESCRAQVASKVLPFPALAQTPAEAQEAPQGHLKLIGGTQR